MEKLPTFNQFVKNSDSYTVEEYQQIGDLLNKEIQKIEKAEIALEVKRSEIANYKRYLEFVQSRLSDNEAPATTVQEGTVQAAYDNTETSKIVIDSEADETTEATEKVM